jgi:WD40 repeat protein
MATQYYNAVAHSGYPYLTVYAQDGDTLTKIANPAVLPTVEGKGAAWTPDSNYLAVASYTSPFFVVYSRSGDTLTKIADPAVLPPDTSNAVAWSAGGTHLAVAHDLSPYVTVYSRSGDTLTKIANPATLPPQACLSASWSPDGTYLVVGHRLGGGMTIYKRSGDTLTKLANPATTPTERGYGSAWTSDGAYLAIAHRSSPYLTVYSRSGDTFTKIANPATLPTGDGRGASWSPDGAYLAISHSNSPYVTVYSRSGDTLTKIANPATLPTGAGYGAAWSPDGTYLSIAHYLSPYTTVYSRSGDTLTKIADPATLPSSTGNATAYSGSLNSAPTAPTWDTAAGTKDVNASLLLDWTFNDPDGDASTAYALQRSVNGGSVEWWTGSAWGTETKIVTAATSLTLASSWATLADSIVYKVKGYDALDVVSPLSAGITIVAGEKVNPTVTLPTAAQVINTGTITPTWICTSQSKYTLRLLSAADAELFTTGQVTSTSLREHSIIYALSNLTTYKIELTTVSIGGVTSDVQTVTFSTSFTSPTSPTLTATADSPVVSAVTVAIDQGTPTETVSYHDLYRREATVGGDGIRIATAVAVDGSVVSYTQRAGTAYEYKVISIGENLTESSSAWT